MVAMVGSGTSTKQQLCPLAVTQHYTEEKWSPPQLILHLQRSWLQQPKLDIRPVASECAQVQHRLVIPELHPSGNGFTDSPMTAKRTKDEAAGNGSRQAALGAAHPFHSSPLVESGGHGGAGCNRVNGPFVNFKLALPGQRICSCALSIKRRTFLPISVLSTSEDYTWIIFVRGLPAHCLIPGHFSIKANASLATAFIWPQRLQLEELIRTSLYPQGTDTVTMVYE
ncbi:hypothetical protein HPB49_001338 [Dermacentor silvarum]|uniref:Uncharacterized protein n=1 Tax=Dermacentor silvarum TaxID=543639 RepID=A0ACB8D1W0_DERSI|nr:hypothetical protein HPB49_001338 [Dermacentor silvarum]